MPGLVETMAERHAEMTAWRRHLHAHPETAFEEHATAAFVAERLREFGMDDIACGIAETGVVATLCQGDGPSIGLRADLDALGFDEAGERPHRSRNPGRTHACGHDGHTVMLLGAARHLAATRRFRGTVRFIFQPAEENEAGGQRMVEDGLFERFPVDRVYGMHNWPSLPAGRMATRPGPIMAACDLFEIAVSGRGCHAAMPHQGTDAILAASSIVVSVQSVAARSVNPLAGAVVSVTQVHGGETWNVLPSRVVLRGTVRTFDASVQDRCEEVVRRIATSQAMVHGCTAEVRYNRRYPATVNEPDATLRAVRAAGLLLGEAAVQRDVAPSMGSEDFAFMLQQRPGCYIWLGSGTDGDNPQLHSPYFDFNDAVLPVGAGYWVTLTEQELRAP